ncbi:hypothetical protein QBC34DRAFT_422719 [Podospora aff. communis PSN243]|uniref:F-box domain-containing protein n=1 Tax=Podospora aff. communis PSN243 TaxID=3040156 RepID=A0AAV9GW50_9PEZI|nr:hypothetical protein QBC34DRAFT_422719 [Podospora aff. communis PSN243]
MHPLIEASHHNTTKSPLCRLPDEVLIRLMQLSGKVTVECLRRCSRTFLRLFPDMCSRSSTLECSVRGAEGERWQRERSVADECLSPRRGFRTSAIHFYYFTFSSNLCMVMSRIYQACLVHRAAFVRFNEY